MVFGVTLFRSLQTITLFRFWVDSCSAIHTLLFCLFWYLEKESARILHLNEMTEFKRCVSCTQDGRAKKDPVSLSASGSRWRKWKARVHSSRVVGACELRNLTRACFSTNRIRDMFHFASLNIKSHSPFELYLVHTTGQIRLEATFLSGLYKWPVTFAGREFRQKACPYSLRSQRFNKWSEELDLSLCNHSSYW